MLEELKNMLWACNQKILKHYHEETYTVRKKQDRSPVTEADLESSIFLVNALKQLTPEIPVISEEMELPFHEERKNWKKYWLIDPLDGTREFIKRNGEFSVCVALIENNIPVTGLISIPTENTIYYAQNGLGAWKQKKGEKPERIHGRLANPEQNNTLIASRTFQENPSLGKDFREFFNIDHIYFVGSAIKFCHLAEGRAELYLRKAPCMEWDVAAGECIYRNSLPESADPALPFRYNKPSFENPNGFIIGHSQSLTQKIKFFSEAHKLKQSKESK